MTVNFVRASQTYNVEQKFSHKNVIGKRVASYDNTFITSMDVSLPFPTAEKIVCAFIEDIILKDNKTEIDDGSGSSWEYCNLQIVADEVTGKMSFSVRLAVPTTESVYAMELTAYSRADGHTEYLSDWHELEYCIASPNNEYVLKTSALPVELPEEE